MKPAILVIDMLNDFVTGELRCDTAQEIIPSIQKLLNAAREHDLPVVYCNDAHLQYDSELKKWGPHAMKGSKGAEVIPELDPTPNDYIIEKRTYSGFFETGLDSLLRDLHSDTVIITGMHTNICDRHTAAGAFFRGYKIVIASDGTGTFTKEEHEQGLKYLEDIYNAKINSTNEIIDSFA
ncbi:isochorismatase family cysteine hydrolase [Candidatus Borrarchaeum sp.]|uniref:cysteine hydrolase family protein n=1 Tax=Candidatus Borrarchaeum sp. TaxID=2846742 RepID=UPI00258008AD|nr:isochorismatase family cysteine hydrolase [Candidatus Borrarchaeum sp.]